MKHEHDGRRKVLLLGSGGLSIGQAGEFDYSGSQAIKALKEEGHKVVLVNPNIATVQTSKDMADTVYFLPVTPVFVAKVIEKEKPDSILLSFGGQTALNCGIALHEAGVLKEHGVEVLGTPVETIILTEDRDLFARRMKEIGVKILQSTAAASLEEAKEAARKIGFPVIIRSGFALGGQGSGFAHDEKELEDTVSKALASAPQVLIEKSVQGWKEIEYEVVRDADDNCVTVCNMENFDPMGIHTGESIVVAPSQTLSNEEYHFLREVAIKAVRSLGVVGECNIQYALAPDLEYRVIEVNARLSRSSALASKATGYPLAYIAAKLALGQTLPAIQNRVTRSTYSCFEPALDYVVVKVPKWDLAKFRKASRGLGSSMKSVGEVMAIGRTFEEAIQKALRMIDPRPGQHRFEDLEGELKNPSDLRIHAINAALRQGLNVERIAELTSIDPWFLHRLKAVVDVLPQLARHTLSTLPADLLLYSKKMGYSDASISQSLSAKTDAVAVRSRRKDLGITPFVKQIDTLAGEFPAQTNYFYLTYHGTSHDLPPAEEGQVLILGSGAYRIGSSVEFDWCCVSCAGALAQLGRRTVMINHNPETVSTDYDICDRLYFEELSLERVLDIAELEKPDGVVVSMGGQIPNNLALSLHKAGLKILGTSPESIDQAEDRHKFSALLDKLGVDQPMWQELTSLESAKAFAAKAGYPVLVRPSYVLSGAAMSVATSDQDLERTLGRAAEVSREHPVVISKFITEAKEIEMDAVARDGRILAYAISEHVENAGIHSGDATLVFPAQKLYLETVRRIKACTRQIAGALKINGPFNVQYIAKENKIKVIECNLRVSRSFPFVSKVSGVDFIGVATKALMGLSVEKVNSSAFELEHVGVKAPQFSFTQLRGADPVLGVEMASTGEVGCLGDDVHEAMLKSLLSAGLRVPRKNILISTGPLETKARFMAAARKLKAMGLDIYATRGTSEFLKWNGVESTVLHWPTSQKKPNVLDFLRNRKIELVINIPKNDEPEELNNDYLIRRTAADYNIPLITNLPVAELLVDALHAKGEVEVRSWAEYFETQPC
ncbi:MAG: carbamoyl-phosphate synthase (glutamine-hydrolyzing) large subunit [Elusimicrobia bacterium]|nr:carbamoyl-phosphate synthase (glutamine-hydrolyzing) large subunit [Elusimicrobiota bacterium]